jgi:hypothetical protein
MQMERLNFSIKSQPTKAILLSELKIAVEQTVCRLYIMTVPYLEDNLAILFQCVQDWATVHPQSGTVIGGATQEISVGINSEELSLGSYLCDITISTNDPNAANYIIPLHLNVVEQILNAPQNVVLSQTGNEMTIQWEAVSGATAYKVFVADSPQGTFQYLTTIPTNTFSHPISTTKLFYRIVAIN